MESSLWVFVDLLFSLGLLVVGLSTYINAQLDNNYSYSEIFLYAAPDNSVSD